MRTRLYQAYPHFQKIDAIAPGDLASLEKLAALGGTAANDAFASPIRDFFLTNPIARASAVMAECSELARTRQQMPQAAE